METDRAMKRRRRSNELRKSPLSDRICVSTLFEFSSIISLNNLRWSISNTVPLFSFSPKSHFDPSKAFSRLPLSHIHLASEKFVSLCKRFKDPVRGLVPLLSAVLSSLFIRFRSPPNFSD
ncbi:Uncharacterized protein Rs2_52524 [Raphanus sativus]|nr:Uncharacterized protein Rs2_52524 [Raphanus sativus]